MLIGTALGLCFMGGSITTELRGVVLTKCSVADGTELTLRKTYAPGDHAAYIKDSLHGA